MFWKERTIRHPPQPSSSSPNKGTSVEGQLWEYGERTIVEKPVTSALNARSWQSGRINEGMTPKQCRAAHCNSQQVGQTLKWQPTKSTNGRPRWREQKNIYNQRDLTKGRTAIRKMPGSSIGGVSEEKKKNSSSDEARGRTLTLSSTTPLTILFPKDLARPLMKSSQRSSS